VLGKRISRKPLFSQSSIPAAPSSPTVVIGDPSEKNPSETSANSKQEWRRGGELQLKVGKEDGKLEGAISCNE